MSEPRLVVVSGPSGVGKTTVCQALVQEPGFVRVMTCTTRAPRGNEQPEVDYHFLTEEEFGRRIDAGEFLEWALVHGSRYGTPLDETQAILAAGEHAVLNIDVQGAASVRDGKLPCLLVFLLPPSMEELERRLRDRKTDVWAEVDRRLETAKQELARKDEYDFHVVNRDVGEAVAEILAALE